MPYDLSDPNLDFAGQAEILARALKQSQLLQQTQADDGVKAGNMFYRSSPLSGVGAALSRGVGQYNQSQAEASQTALNQEQLKRYDELTRQMNAPQEGTDYSNPDALMADNTCRMGIATQMSKLPLAQKTAQDYLSKGAAFPEAIAKMRMDQIERGQQAAQKATDAKERIDAIIANQKWMAQLAADSRMSIAQMAAALKASNGPTTAQQKRIDQIEATEKGKEDMTYTVNGIDEALTSLDKLGGTVNTNRGSVVNTRARLANSSVGQLVAGTVGTKEQELRDILNNSQLSLLNAIKAANPSISSKQIDSNAELKTWLKSLGDNTQSVQTRKDTLKNIVHKYGSPGAFIAPAEDTAKPTAPSGGLSPQEQSELDQLRNKHRK